MLSARLGNAGSVVVLLAACREGACRERPSSAADDDGDAGQRGGGGWAAYTESVAWPCGDVSARQRAPGSTTAAACLLGLRAATVALLRAEDLMRPCPRRPRAASLATARILSRQGCGTGAP